MNGNKKLKNYCLSILDSQRSHVKYKTDSGISVAIDTPENKLQEAFYIGLRDMFEMVVSNAYEREAYIVFENGAHKLKKNPGKE